MAQRSDLLTAPTVCRPKTLSEFNKAELLEEAPCEEFVDKRQMVDCGTPVSHPGGQEEPVCKSSREHHEGHAQHDVGGAEDPSDGVGIPCASPRDPGNPDEDPTRPRGDGTGVSAGIWPASAAKPSKRRPWGIATGPYGKCKPTTTHPRTS